ncbi:hypothetical protein GCM10023200_51420 [Actinomycetospora chlora]|uniref:ABM domain-containing protein n=1 Tax=Actinomycetospora chlora TaxID=663608 RepID=A0ABP9CFJ9_9PSEU
MVYAFTQDVPIDEALYRRIMEQLGPEPLAGQVLHLCVRRPDGGLRYIDVWESEEACARAFDERIHPAVDAAFGGTRPGTEPRVDRLEVIDAQGALLHAAGS